MNYKELHSEYNIKQTSKNNTISNKRNKGGDICKLNYDVIYDKYLEPYRGKNVKLLEIGIFMGDSLFIHSKFLVNPKLYGIDINLNFIKERYKDTDFLKDLTLFENSSTNKKFSNKIKEKFDIIIDDGDHHPNAMINTFLNFYNKLNKNGIYLIEDVKTKRYKPVKNFLNSNRIKFIYEKTVKSGIIIIYKNS